MKTPFKMEGLFDKQSYIMPIKTLLITNGLTEKCKALKSLSNDEHIGDERQSYVFIAVACSAKNGSVINR